MKLQISGIIRGAAMHPEHGVAEEIHRVAQAQLVFDVFAMGFNGFWAHMQFRGDICGLLASANHLEHLQFPVRQALDVLVKRLTPRAFTGAT